MTESLTHSKPAIIYLTGGLVHYVNEKLLKLENVRVELIKNDTQLDLFFSNLIKLPQQLKNYEFAYSKYTFSNCTKKKSQQQ